MSEMVHSGQGVGPRIRGEASYHVLSRAHMGPGSNFTSTLTSNASASLVFGFLAGGAIFTSASESNASASLPSLVFFAADIVTKPSTALQSASLSEEGGFFKTPKKNPHSVRILK